MDKKQALILAHNFLEIVCQKYEVEWAFLFGSFAKGFQHADSDIDIAIIIDSSHDIIDTQIDLMKLRRKIDLRIEPHPILSADFHRNEPLCNEIMNHGIEIIPSSPVIA